MLKHVGTDPFAAKRTRLPLVRYVALLNQDTIVRPMWLVALYQLAEQRPDAGPPRLAE